MRDALTFAEIADALDALADVSDRMDELAGHNASFWRDAALVLRRVDDAPGPESTRAAGFSGSPERS
jgi:hypothetical protein